MSKALPRSHALLRTACKGGVRAISGLRRPASLSLLLGLGIALSYGVFSALAAWHYPSAYSPVHNNTLSQLGNSTLNPHGAAFYLIGCALSGALTMAFFGSLGPWKVTGTRAQNRLLTLLQLLGAVGGFGLIMNAVYPENQLTLHHFWAGVVFNCLAAAMLLSPFALRRPAFPSASLTGVPLLGVATVVLMFAFARTHWVEWLPVTMFLIAPSLLGAHTRKVSAAAVTVD